jgi:hypothetical protein
MPARSHGGVQREDVQCGGLEVGRGRRSKGGVGCDATMEWCARRIGWEKQPTHRLEWQGGLGPIRPYQKLAITMVQSTIYAS